MAGAWSVAHTTCTGIARCPLWVPPLWGLRVNRKCISPCSNSKNWGWGCISGVECLPSVHEALGLIPAHELVVMTSACNPSTGKQEGSGSFSIIRRIQDLG